MPLRLSRPLLAFALAASALACAAAAPLVSQAAPAAVAPAIAAAPLEGLEPGPRPYPPTRAKPKPTLGDRAAAIALRAIGTPYRWGGSSPASGFDCSGLVYWAYGRLGMELPHSSYALHDLGRSVARSRPRTGRSPLLRGTRPCRRVRRPRPHGARAAVRTARRGRHLGRIQLRQPLRRRPPARAEKPHEMTVVTRNRSLYRVTEGESQRPSHGSARARASAAA
jgi:cell wall-associated NlpC family hydrolase